MSFGASPSDTIIVVTFCKALYRKCRDAGGEYDEISRDVRGKHIQGSKVCSAHFERMLRALRYLLPLRLVLFPLTCLEAPLVQLHYL
jgi:hypothetical protein